MQVYDIWSIGRKDQCMNSKEGKIIIVVGATGRQGREVVRHLVRNGWRVKGMTRKPESKKATAVRALGAELVPADLDDITTLESAFQGAYGVYTMQPPILGKPENEIQLGCLFHKKQRVTK